MFQNIVQLLGQFFFQKILKILSDHISKTKNRKNQLNLRFRKLRNLLDQKMKTALFEGGGCLRVVTKTRPR